MGSLEPEAKLMAWHDFIGDKASTTSTFVLGGTPFTTTGATPARDSYELTARFSNLGQLRKQAPVKIGGVVIGQVADIQLDPVKFDSIVTLSIDSQYKDLPADTAAGIFTSGLLGENYIGLSPGGDPEVLKPGEEIAFTQPAVDLLQLAGKYMFSGGANNAGAGSGETPASGETAPPVTEEPTP